MSRAGVRRNGVFCTGSSQLFAPFCTPGATGMWTVTIGENMDVSAARVRLGGASFESVRSFSSPPLFIEVPEGERLRSKKTHTHHHPFRTHMNEGTNEDTNGPFRRPRGGTPKGKKWDTFQGAWVPLSDQERAEQTNKSIKKFRRSARTTRVSSPVPTGKIQASSAPGAPRKSRSKNISAQQSSPNAESHSSTRITVGEDEVMSGVSMQVQVSISPSNSTLPINYLRQIAKIILQQALYTGRTNFNMATLSQAQ